MSQMDYLFVDCRWALDDPELGRRLYREGHIPGAVFVDLERDLSAPPGPGGRHPLPSGDEFAAAMSRIGVGDGVFVVAYGSVGGAERLWWLLRHFGHDACAVIDLDDWRGPLAAGDEEPAPSVFTPRERSDDTVTIDELEGRVLVDARLPARWRGEPNPVDKVPGRIPGALNAPWNAPLPELPDGDLVAYCGSGVTACVVLHRLALTGRDARLYPGSWSEYEQTGRPVERGA
jgi:thiosulfate/3-mercaptopyruvate sulfurtransferase